MARGHKSKGAASRTTPEQVGVSLVDVSLVGVSLVVAPCVCSVSSSMAVPPQELPQPAYLILKFLKCIFKDLYQMSPLEKLLS